MPACVQRRAAGRRRCEAKNQLLRQLAAAATGRRILAWPTEVRSLANFGVQILAMGAAGPLADARELIARFHPPRRMRPNLGIRRLSPVTLLFTPRECTRAVTRIMTIEDVRRMFRVLDFRERLIAKPALLAGMRPGDIFGMTRSRLDSDCGDIRQLVYRVMSTHQSWLDLYDLQLFQMVCSCPFTGGGPFPSTLVLMLGSSPPKDLRRSWQKTIVGGGISYAGSDH